MTKNQSRRIARQRWETFHQACLLPKIQIHHLNGDPFDNRLENLLAVTPEEHWHIHFEQGDPIALRGKFIQGADNWKGGKHTPEAKQKITNSKIGKIPWNKGLKNPYGFEDLRRRSAAQSGIKNHRFGKTLNSAEKTIRAEKAGSLPFLAYKSGFLFGEFVSKSECERLTGVKRASIRKILKKQQSSTRDGWSFVLK